MSDAVPASEVRRIILRQSKRANVGHIGSALSVADLLAALYSGPLAGARPGDPERHRFILSKGHAALALYAALSCKGLLSAHDLDSFNGDGSLLGVHPEYELPGIDFATGSLGQGLSIAAGAALAARLQGSPRRIFVLISDAECNEGAVWEAVMFAAHHALDNLCVIVNLNGQQAFGYTRDVMDTSPLAARWQVFGWDVREVDGHDLGAIGAALDGVSEGTPRVLIARTTFGKGVSFMENRIPWHYLPMSDEHYSQAMAEIGSAP